MLGVIVTSQQVDRSVQCGVLSYEFLQTVHRLADSLKVASHQPQGDEPLADGFGPAEDLLEFLPGSVISFNEIVICLTGDQSLIAPEAPAFNGVQGFIRIFELT